MGLASTEGLGRTRGAPRLIDHFEPLADDRHARALCTAKSCALAREEGRMVATPRFETSIAFALGIGKVFRDFLERSNFDGCGLDDAKRLFRPCGHDAQVTRFGLRPTVIVRPDQARGCALRSLQHELSQFLRHALAVAESESFEETSAIKMRLSLLGRDPEAFVLGGDGRQCALPAA